jgi:hypothetical protein
VQALQENAIPSRYWYNLASTLEVLVGYIEVPTKVTRTLPLR